MDEGGKILLKEFKIWNTLTPFGNTKMKNHIPRLKLVMVGGLKESDLFGGEDKVRILTLIFL